MTELKAALVDSRYTIENQLTSNAFFGDLLQGIDEQTKRPVLLHRLSPLVVSFIGHEQIQLRTQLYQVPNLPMMSVLDVYGSSEGTVVVYDAVEHAVPLLTYIEGKSLPLIIEVLQRLCEALAQLHDRTMWHGGLVPEYIWVLRSGEVRLLTMPTDSPLSLHNANGQGLPMQFFAPETMAMSPFDARTDIYNLGVLFYLVLTERYPFDQEQGDTLYPPSRFNPHIPPQLDRLILKMINKRPTKRIQFIGQTIDELMRMLGRNEYLCKLERQTFGSQQLFSAEFTGRTDELATLSAFYEKMTIGGRHNLLITGKQGVGRRRLIYEVSGHYVQKVSGISSTVREKPFSAVEGFAMKLIFLCFMVPNLEGIGKAYLKPLSKILPRVAYEYKDMLNELSEGEEERPETESLLFQFFTEVLESYEDPLVLELYEAHLLDAESIQFFKRLLANENVCLGLIGVAEEASPQLLSLFPNHMPLEPLPLDLMRECVMSRFGDADFLSDEFIQWLNHHARGSLGTVFQLIDYLADTSQIYLQRYVWHMVTSSVEKLNIPESMESLILYRLEQLSPQAKAVCQVASLFKGVFMYEAISKAAGISSVNELLQVMHALEEQGLLLQAHTLYRFPSNNVKTHIYQSIPPEERRELHHKLAECLWETGSQEYMEIAHHFERGEDWKRAIYLYIKGARRCQVNNQLADAEWQIATAIKLYERVPERVCPNALHTFRARILRMAGHLRDAAAVYRDLYERTGSLAVFTVLMLIYGTLFSFADIEPHLPMIREKIDSPSTPHKQRMQLLVVYGLYAIEHGDYAVIKEMEEYQAEHGATLREEMRIRDYINWLSNFSVLLTHMPGVPWEKRSRYLQEAASLAEHHNVRSQLIGIYNLMAIGFQETEPLKAKDYYLQSAKLAADLSDKSKEQTAYANLAEIYRLLGDMYHSYSYIEKARETGTAVSQYDDAYLLQTEIEYFLFIEDYPKAKQVIQKLNHVAKLTGQRKMRDYAFLYLFRFCAEQGDKRRATRMWPIVERICLTRKFTNELQFARTSYYMLTKRHKEVIEEFNDLISETNVPTEIRIKRHLVLISALLEVGRWQEGLEVALSVQCLIHNTGYVGFLARAHFYLGRLYQLTHQFVQANLNYKRALMWFRKLNQQSRMAEIDRLMRQTNQEMVRAADGIIDRMKQDVERGEGDVAGRIATGGNQLKEWARTTVRERQEMIDTLTDNEILLDAIRRVSSSIMVKTVCENLAAVVFENLLFDNFHMHIKISENRQETIHLNEQLQDVPYGGVEGSDVELLIESVIDSERALEIQGDSSYLYGIPVLSHDQQVIAVFVLEKLSLQTPFTVRDKRFITSLAQLVSSNVENATMYEVMITDNLTGLYNRNYFMKRMHEEYNKIARYEIDLSFLMIDLDNFSQVNNRYGHNEGDRVLRTVAQTLLRSVRQVDIVGRFGGEEIIVILPNTNGVAAKLVAERILHNLRSIPVEGDRYKITASIGVSSFDMDAPTDVLDLMEKADQAETYAKRIGKNRVVCHWEMIVALQEEQEKEQEKEQEQTTTVSQ